MSPKPALAREPNTVSSEVSRLQNTSVATIGALRIASGNGSIHPVPAKKAPSTSFQPRVPVITGEATYRGMIPIDGIISGHLGAAGSALSIKQRPGINSDEPVPELNGEITFKDMLRINGFVAGKIFSFKGTLIVDNSARVDADIDVSVCVVSGTVNGDVVAQQRVELGPAAVINGDISTTSLSMRPGAIFTGNCRMLKNQDGAE
jgi:cytoskeletal protein CcmA (bactofilin family)